MITTRDITIANFNHGNKSYGEKLFDEALEQYQTAIKNNPATYDANFCIPQTQIYLGKDDNEKSSYIKKVKLLISFLAFFTTLFLQAQTQTRDVLYLKNGSIIKGAITEMNPSSGIKIKTSDGSIFVYKMEEVLKTEKEEFSAQSSSNNSSPSINLKSLSDFFSNFFINKKLDALKYIGVSKVNGVRREVFGQKIYDVEYELLIQANQDIYISDRMTLNTDGFLRDFKYLTQQPTGWDAYMNSGTKKVSKGQKILINGSMSYEETDNGWRAKSYSNKSYKVVASNYVSPTMAKQIAEEKAKEEAKLKKELDWKSKDSEPAEFIPKYYSLKNVPIFNFGNSEYSIEPSTTYNGRNDVASSIQDVFFKAINSTQRSTASNNNEFSSSKNSGYYKFKITNANFKFNNQGYQCSIKVIGEAHGTYHSPKKYSFKYPLKLTGNSNKFKKGMSKHEALNSALLNFEKAVRGMVFKHEPILIDFVKIITSNDGKVEKIIFKKPNRFVNIKKLKFILLKPDAMLLDGDNFKISDKIGDCIYKGEIIDNDIVCRVRGRKNKKLIEKYINTTEKLVGLSMF